LAATAIADTGFVVALLSRRDNHHEWATAQAAGHIPPWQTCEPVLTEAMYVLGSEGLPQIAGLLRREMLTLSFNLAQNHEPVFALMKKYNGVPMSLADACLVRMSELIAEPIVITTDFDFRVYRRHGRQVVPCVLPD
jgi:predicted nucleic acid-binding protein